MTPAVSQSQPPRRAGRPRRELIRFDLRIELTPEAHALGSRVRETIAAAGVAIISEDELAPVWNGDTDRDWRLLRLHRFARGCGAAIRRDAGGSVHFFELPRAARSPLFQFVATLAHSVPDLRGVPPETDGPAGHG